MIRKFFSLLAIAFFAVATFLVFPASVSAETLLQPETTPQANQNFQESNYTQKYLYIASQDQSYDSAKNSQSNQNNNDQEGQNDQANQGYQGNNDQATQGYQGNNDQNSQQQKQSSSYNEGNKQK